MNKLWYNEPARCWEEALPIGNGRLGAMIFGGERDENLQLNEDSIWYGAPVNRNNPDALKNLEEVRKLIFSGQIQQAQQLLVYGFSGTPSSERPYQPLGDMYLRFQGIGSTKEYKRELNISEAIHRVWVSDEMGQKICRETYATAEDSMIVMELTSEKPMNFHITLYRDFFFNRIYRYNHNSIVMDGELGDGGNSFATMARAVAEDGIVEVIGEHLIVKETTKATIYFTATTAFYSKVTRNTDFVTEKVSPEQLAKEADDIITKGVALGYESLKERHIKDYQRLFQRVSLELEYDNELDKLTTKERLKRLDDQHPDNGLIQLYYQFGRYLMIAGSRPGTLPLNLQGIWNKDLRPAWGSKYTININTEMNYWPAETCNLSECHEPLFDLIKRMVDKGRVTAKSMYDCRGFVAHHNTDFHGDTAPQDIYIPATYWVMGAAWLCTHIWEHYRYTKKDEFLKEYYPIMKEAALFFIDYLVEDEKGYMVTCPSVSPENTYILPSGESGCICAGATMDNQILRDLFEQCIKSAEILGVDQEFAKEWKTLQDRLLPTTIGSQGQILEWREEYKEAEPGHRHISHLYGLYPSHQITVDKTPELAKAARKTLEGRLGNGGGHTGWSRAWIINMYARLWDGESAYHHLIKILTQSTLNNLFDNHPPFQIDGNFGATAAVVEMLVQSDEERVILLPALPEKWNKGKITGIRLVGGAEIDIEWNEKQLIRAVITAHHGYETNLCYGEEIRMKVSIDAGQKYIYDYLG